MMTMRNFLARFHRDTSGSALIETAFVAPFLVLMSLGGVEISNMVKRQSELQNAASKAAEIIMVADPEDDAEFNEMLADVASKIEDDTGLNTKVLDYIQDPDENEPNVAYVIRRFRCGNSKNFKKADTGCTDSTNAREFIVFLLRDDYTPVWKDFGLGETLQYRVEKSIQIG